MGKSQENLESRLPANKRPRRLFGYGIFPKIGVTWHTGRESNLTGHLFTRQVVWPLIYPIFTFKESCARDGREVLWHSLLRTTAAWRREGGVYAHLDLFLARVCVPLSLPSTRGESNRRHQVAGGTMNTSAGGPQPNAVNLKIRQQRLISEYRPNLAKTRYVAHTKCICYG